MCVQDDEGGVRTESFLDIVPDLGCEQRIGLACASSVIAPKSIVPGSVEITGPVLWKRFTPEESRPILFGLLQNELQLRRRLI
mmetsp:Transcript_21909/g.46423  ORF Transcript_21909/g.46423 Transcript_21909/m.46423 type:complete len:83 (+) Transcript_21909:403-651(+)